MSQISLMKNQMHQDKHFRDLAMQELPDCKFSTFLATHPRLYDAVDLDTGTIDYLNNYFWEYEVNPVTFERHFITKLKRLCAVYNNMKAIEFNEKVFDVTTDTYVRNLVHEATNELARTGGRNAKTTNTGSIKDSATSHEDASNAVTYGKTESETTTKTVETEHRGSDTTITNTNAKQAIKNLPMQTGVVNMQEGVDLDWTKGASGVQQNKNSGNNTLYRGTNDDSYEEDVTSYATRGTDSSKGSTDGKSTNDRTLSSEINYEDQTTLQDLGNAKADDNETLEITRGQGVELIQKIWNYLLAPKALDYLTDNLQSCFILVY